MKHFLFFILLSAAPLSFAQELIIRADKHQPQSLPVWSKMPSTSPACNDKGVATKYLSFFEKERLHPALTQKVLGKSIFSKHFSADLSVSDLHLTSDQETIFALNYRGGTEGVFGFSESGVLQQLVKKEDFPGVIAMSRPSVVSGKVLFRALDRKGLHQIYLGSEPLFSEKDDVAYLYLPTSKNNQIVFKIGHGSPGEVSQKNPDRILSVLGGVTTVVAVDREYGPESKFLSFDNSPIPGGDGSVAFIANHEVHKRSLWLFKGGVHHLIFSEQNSPYKLEYFSPALNPKGDVVFRMIKDKKRSVFLWSNQKQQLIELMVQGQAVKVNEENIRVIDRDRWPAFSGKPCVSDDGTVYIHAVLESSLSFENKGSGIFKFR